MDITRRVLLKTLTPSKVIAMVMALGLLASFSFSGSSKNVTKTDNVTTITKKAASDKTYNLLFPAVTNYQDISNQFVIKDGRPSGYYGELMTHISEMACVTFKYIVPKTQAEWSGMLNAFLSGSDYTDSGDYSSGLHIDLAPNMSKDNIVDAGLGDNISFSTNTDCSAPEYLITQMSNTTISDFDLSTYVSSDSSKKTKVGLTKTRAGIWTANSSRFISWATKNGLYDENDIENSAVELVPFAPLYDGTVLVNTSLVLRDEAFKAGDIDIMIDLNSISKDDCRTLQTISYIDSYIGFDKNEEKLFSLVDSMLNKLHDDGKDYLSPLREKWFPAHYARIILNESEKDYLRKNPTATVFYTEEYFPMIYPGEDGTLDGIIPQYFRIVRDTLQSNAFVGRDSTTNILVELEMLSGTELEARQKTLNTVGGIYVNRSTQHPLDDEAPLFNTDSYLEGDVHYVSQRSNPLTIDECSKIGVAQSGMLARAVSDIPESKLVHYDSMDTMLQDLNKGNIDGAVSFYSYYKYARYTLRYDNIVDIGQAPSASLCFATNETNKELHTILNKAIHYMTTSGEAESLLVKYKNNYTYTVTSSDFVTRNWALVAGLGIGVGILLISAVVFLALMLISKKKNADRFQLLSQKDPLVDLYNKQALITKTNQLIESHTPFSFFMIDLNDFKSINDAYGHLSGDETLKEAANRLNSLSDSANTVARIGGDEFAIISLQHTEDKIKMMCRTILNQATRPVEIEGGIRIHTNFSIGVARYPENGKTVDEVYISADDAMYSVKETHRPGYEIFSEEKTYDQQKQVLIKIQLEKAILEKRVYMVFQPIVNIRKNTIEGFEALMRIKEFEVSPAEFIPVAEKTGQMIALGKIALQKGCNFARRLKDNGTPATVSINISGVQADDPDLHETVFKAMADNGVSFDDIVFETTESVFFKKEMSKEEIKAIHDHGIKLALDDFGTGFSSLTSLSHFPYQTVKFDKSLIDQIETSPQIIRLFDYVQGFGFHVLAEGVERKEQLDILLKETECRFVQGFYFSKPLEEKDALAFITNFGKKK